MISFTRSTEAFMVVNDPLMVSTHGALLVPWRWALVPWGPHGRRPPLPTSERRLQALDQNGKSVVTGNLLPMNKDLGRGKGGAARAGRWDDQPEINRAGLPSATTWGPPHGLRKLMDEIETKCGVRLFCGRRWKNGAHIHVKKNAAVSTCQGKGNFAQHPSGFSTNSAHSFSSAITLLILG